MDRLSPKQLRDIQSAVEDVYPNQEVEENYSESEQQVAKMLVEFVKSLDEEQLKTIREETLDESWATAARVGSNILKYVTGFGRTGRVAGLQKAATGATVANTIMNPVKVGQDLLGGVENVTRAARAFVGQGVPAKNKNKWSTNRDDYELRDGQWYRK